MLFVAAAAHVRGQQKGTRNLRIPRCLSMKKGLVAGCGNAYGFLRMPVCNLGWLAQDHAAIIFHAAELCSAIEPVDFPVPALDPACTDHEDEVLMGPGSRAEHGKFPGSGINIDVRFCCQLHDKKAWGIGIELFTRLHRSRSRFGLLSRTGRKDKECEAKKGSQGKASPGRHGSNPINRRSGLCFSWGQQGAVPESGQASAQPSARALQCDPRWGDVSRRAWQQKRERAERQ